MKKNEKNNQNTFTLLTAIQWHIYCGADCCMYQKPAIIVVHQNEKKTNLLFS